MGLARPKINDGERRGRTTTAATGFPTLLFRTGLKKRRP